MSRYKVELIQTVYETATIFVEADNEENAELAALQAVEKEEIEWIMADVVGDFEVTHCEPMS